MSGEYEITTNTQPYAEDLGIEESLSKEVQYGIRVALKNGNRHTFPQRWNTWGAAANYGEARVRSGSVIGFWVFKDPSE